MIWHGKLSGELDLKNLWERQMKRLLKICKCSNFSKVSFLVTKTKEKEIPGNMRLEKKGGDTRKVRILKTGGRGSWEEETHENMQLKGPWGQNSLEKAHEPRVVCFKFWVKKSYSCFIHSARLHVGDVDVFWNSEPDSRRQFSLCFWSACFVFRKMRFRTESAETYHPKHTPEGGATIGRLLKMIGLFCRIQVLFFYRALLQKRRVILRSLLLEATS